MNNHTAISHCLAMLLTAFLLSGLFIFCGCTRPTSADADLSDAEEVEIQIETEPTQPPPISETDTAIPTEALTEAVPTQTTYRITETAAPMTTAEPVQQTSAVPTSSAYAVVPRMTARPFAEVGEQLDAAGISYTVTEQYSAEQAAGHVITARFHGKLDGEFCYIHPDYPVEVTVSLGKRVKSNVVAVDPMRIYLTFDDGPHKNTDRVLEILEQYNVKASFFTVGRYVAVYPDRAKAIADGGHLLACHSYTHDYLTLYQSAESVLDEIHKWEQTLLSAGVTLPGTVYFRFPGGTTTHYMERDRFEEIFWAITDAGYRSVDWTCANNDRYLNHKTEDQTLQEYLLASVKATLLSLGWTPSTPKIMLMHDTADETVEALPQILDYLIGAGYTFGTLDELDGYWVFH